MYGCLGGKKLGSSWRSWLLQSASLVAQLTPCLPTPAPPFDPSDKRGVSSTLDEGEGLTKVPRGSLSRVHTPRQLFCQSSSTGLSRGRHAFDLQPPCSLRTSFVPDNLLASHQPLEVLVGPGAMDVMESGSPQRYSQCGARGGRQPHSKTAAPCAKAKPKLKFPHSCGHQGLLAMEISVVPVQHCSLAGHGTYGSPHEFWEVFSFLPQHGAGESHVSVATNRPWEED